MTPKHGATPGDEPGAGQDLVSTTIVATRGWSSIDMAPYLEDDAPRKPRSRPETGSPEPAYPDTLGRALGGRESSRLAEHWPEAPWVMFDTLESLRDDAGEAEAVARELLAACSEEQSPAFVRALIAVVQAHFPRDFAARFVPYAQEFLAPPPCQQVRKWDHDAQACPACLRRRQWAREEADRQDAETALAGSASSSRYVTGGTWLSSLPENPVPIWGEGSRVLQASGEATLIVGSPGVGKSTLAQQLVLGRCGVPGFESLLGFPITEGRRVLYLASDRPQQIGRSLRRMVDPEHFGLLDQTLVIWEGPPEAAMTKRPELLRDMCRQARADYVVVDSLKDMGSVLDDEGGTGWNTARQLALVDGVQVLELHHARKGSDGARTMTALDDVYGSTWVTSGVGSVLALNGRAGDPIVELRHLKQPAEEVGPLKLAHDHAHGRTTVWDQVDLVALAGQEGGITALEAAKAMFDTAKPTNAEKEKARRALVRLTREGLLRQVEPGSQSEKRAAAWGAP